MSGKVGGKMKIVFEGAKLHLEKHAEHEFLLTTKEVAEGYGVAESTIRDHKSANSDELVENKHFLCVGNSDAQTATNNPKTREATLWIKRGIIRLGFFIKSERARKFRDMIEDLVLEGTTQHHIKQLETKIKQLQTEDKKEARYEKRMLGRIVNQFFYFHLDRSYDGIGDFEELYKGYIQYCKEGKYQTVPRAELKTMVSKQLTCVIYMHDREVIVHGRYLSDYRENPRWAKYENKLKKKAGKR